MREIASSTLSADVFSTLKERIIRWEYAPGQRLTEEGLCEEFGVSRSPVREALRMLVENNLVDKAPHKSYSVKQLDFQEIHELYDVRMALELYVVERLIQRGYPKKDWEALRRTWQDMRKAAMTSSSTFAARDEAFHETLAAWTGNQTLLQQIRSIDERLHFIRMADITTAERLRTTCEHHVRILDCIKDKDIECAREALQLNIEEGRKNVEHAIKEALARAYLGSKAGA